MKGQFCTVVLSKTLSFYILWTNNQFKPCCLKWRCTRQGVSLSGWWIWWLHLHCWLSGWATEARRSPPASPWHPASRPLKRLDLSGNTFWIHQRITNMITLLLNNKSVSLASELALVMTCCISNAANFSNLYQCNTPTRRFHRPQRWCCPPTTPSVSWSGADWWYIRNPDIFWGLRYRTPDHHKRKYVLAHLTFYFIGCTQTQTVIHK